MNARDALEVVRYWLPKNFAKREEAIAVLTNLVERAGEPVAEPMYGAMIETDFEHNAVTFEMRGEYVFAAGLYEIRKHVPPAAPGASHE